MAEKKRWRSRARRRVKDREFTIDLDPGRVQILVLQTSSRPVEYAIVLRVIRGGQWQAVISADNAHEHDADSTVAPHHYHEYIGGERQSAKPLPFSPETANEAMSGVLRCFKSHWQEFTES